jgi:hypothetical protein
MKMDTFTKSRDGSRKATTPTSRTQNNRQNNEACHIRTLRRHPYYDQIIKRIVAGKSVQSIARWCESSASEAHGVKNFAFYTWRLYVSTLRQRIRPLLEDVEIGEPTPELYENLIDQIRRDHALPFEEKKSGTRPPMQRISTSVKIAIDEVEAEKILKFAFLVQADRVGELLKREAETGVLEKDGYKEILALVTVGAALGKVELGQQFMRAGKVYSDSRTAPAKHVAKTQAEASEPPHLDPDPFLWGKRNG